MSGPFKVAALYVEPRGVYASHDRIDAWPESRDARQYSGPWPVVSHPPCERWGRYAKAKGQQIGDDGGCFAAALLAVRKYGGIIEHPEGSHAWRTFFLQTPPRKGGWVRADDLGGWTCCVAQGHYGHKAQKLTWLYAKGVVLPDLRWGPVKRELPEGLTKEQRARAVKTGICQRLSKNQRKATPVEFRNLLLSIAGSALWVTA